MRRKEFVCVWRLLISVRQRRKKKNCTPMVSDQQLAHKTLESKEFSVRFSFCVQAKIRRIQGWQSINGIFDKNRNAAVFMFAWWWSSKRIWNSIDLYSVVFFFLLAMNKQFLVFTSFFMSLFVSLLLVEHAWIIFHKIFFFWLFLQHHPFHSVQSNQKVFFDAC